MEIVMTPGAGQGEVEAVRERLASFKVLHQGPTAHAGLVGRRLA